MSSKVIDAIDSLLMTIEKGGHGSGPRVGQHHPHVGAGDAGKYQHSGLRHMGTLASNHAHRATMRTADADKKDTAVDGNDAAMVQSMAAMGHARNSNHADAANSHTSAMLSHQEAANNSKPGSGKHVGHIAAADAHEHAAAQHHFANHVTKDGD